MKHLLSLLALVSAARMTQDRWVPDQTWLNEPRLYTRPRDGYVRKKETAVAIGAAIVAGRYGDDFRKECEPYDARRFDDVWVVYGYAPRKGPKDQALGGTVTVQISASTGTILNTSIDQ